MNSDPATVEIATSVPTEAEATLVVAALAEQGVRARIAGGYTSEFKAAAPANVAILVARSDVDQARKILQDLEEGRANVDWSQVEIGVAESTSASGESEEDRDDRPPPEPVVALSHASVVRGRRILLALLLAQVGLSLAARLHFGVTSVGWAAVGLAVLGFYYGCWYACWQGRRWGYRLLVAISVMGVIGMLLPPYSLNGYFRWLGGLLDLLIAGALLLSPSVKAFLAHQRGRSR